VSPRGSNTVMPGGDGLDDRLSGVPGYAEGLEVRPLASRPADPSQAASRLSAFTVDVEDWYQSCVDIDAPISERVVRNVDRILAILDAKRVKGTFFVQGRVAETYPQLLRDLVAEGHEIQSHGYSHRPLYSLSRSDLREELHCARAAVEDACAERVTAFRAPDFSILPANLWALEALVEAGFEVDSSLFPARAPRYGLPGWELGPHRITLPGGGEILEVPVAIWPIAGLRVPVAGGGYFRVLPRRVLERGMRAIRDSGRPMIMYCHPYEFSPRELDDYRGEVPARERLSQSSGRAASIRRITRLLDTFPFGRFDDTLRSWGLPIGAPPRPAEQLAAT
jgi:polysaccharide deacetylase family protein (PEP-CTERM system associated)